jgi:hypothetical protein
MPACRLCRLDPETGHFTGVEELYAADDVPAVHAIQQRRLDTAVELWSGGRRITRLAAPLEPVPVPVPRREPAD